MRRTLLLSFILFVGAFVQANTVLAEPTQDPTIKAVLFDTFGTVVDWRGTMLDEFTALFKQKGIDDGMCDTFVTSWVQAYAENMRAVNEGRIPFATVDELNQMALDKTLQAYDWFERFSSEERHRMWSVWHRLRPWPDSVSGLNELKKQRIIGTLSNGNIKLLIDLSKQAHLDWDVIFAGDLFGHYKPNPFVYQHAAKLLNLDPAEILLVASHKYDLDAARACGFKTAYIFRPLEFGAVRDDQLADEHEYDFVTTGIDQLADMLR